MIEQTIQKWQDKFPELSKRKSDLIYKKLPFGIIGIYFQKIYNLGYRPLFYFKSFANIKYEFSTELNNNIYIDYISFDEEDVYLQELFTLYIQHFNNINSLENLIHFQLETIETCSENLLHSIVSVINLSKLVSDFSKREAFMSRAKVLLEKIPQTLINMEYLSKENLIREVNISREEVTNRIMITEKKY